MPRSHAVHRKTFELSIAAPQVIAHRLTRMALAGSSPSARDRKEFTGMVMEKQVAFMRSWMAAWQQMFTMQSTFGAWGWKQWSAIANAAITPLHAKATSNARRLARTPLVSRRR
jgi:hypothetical protein